MRLANALAFYYRQRVANSAHVDGGCARGDVMAHDRLWLALIVTRKYDAVTLQVGLWVFRVFRQLRCSALQFFPLCSFAELLAPPFRSSTLP